MKISMGLDVFLICLALAGMIGAMVGSYLRSRAQR
jgi:hypothetical protein